MKRQRGHRVLILLTQGRFTMSTVRPTTRDNPTVALLDNPGVASAVCLLGRILISVIFLISGTSKVTTPAATIAYIASAGLPFPSIRLGDQYHGGARPRTGACAGLSDSLGRGRDCRLLRGDSDLLPPRLRGPKHVAPFLQKYRHGRWPPSDRRFRPRPISAWMRGLLAPVLVPTEHILTSSKKESRHCQ